MSEERVIDVVELRVDFEAHPWWLVTFHDAEPRFLPPADTLGSLTSALLGEPPKVKALRWAVLGWRFGDLRPRWTRRVVGLQSTRGMLGAPAEFVRWSTYPLAASILHEFELDPCAVDPIDGLLFNATPWRS